MSTQKMTASALLIAVGVIIPMFSPVKILLEPMSFTLASHVAIFIAMMISPGVAVATALGTTVGFLASGFPLVVVLRALSHIVFALFGSIYLKRRPETLSSPVRIHAFSFIVALIHATCEVIVVCQFYFNGLVPSGAGFLYTVLVLVGCGSIVHSMVDFEISLVVYKVLSRQKSFATLGDT